MFKLAIEPDIYYLILQHCTPISKLLFKRSCSYFYNLLNKDLDELNIMVGDSLCWKLKEINHIAIRTDNLSLFEYSIHTESYNIEYMVKMNSINIIKWIIARNHNVLDMILYSAIANINLSITEWVYSYILKTVGSHHMYSLKIYKMAVDNDDLDTLKWIHDNRISLFGDIQYDYYKLCEYSMHHNRFAILRWVISVEAIDIERLYKLRRYCHYNITLWLNDRIAKLSSNH